MDFFPIKTLIYDQRYALLGLSVPFVGVGSLLALSLSKGSKAALCAARTLERGGITLAWTIDDAVSHKALRDTKIFVREVSFRLGDLGPKIHIRLFRYPGDKEIYFEQSHFLQTPDQTSPVVPPLKSDNNEADALTHAVEILTLSYEHALALGHEPSVGWLVPNPDY